MAETILFESQELSFSVDDEFGVCAQVAPPPFELALGETYKVIWDGVEYEVSAIDTSAVIPGSVSIGNGAPFNLPGNNEPFAIGYTPGVAVLFMALTDTESSTHTVSVYHMTEDVVIHTIKSTTLKAIGDAIRAKTGGTDKITPENMPAAISGITGGGGSSADVRYVTFTNPATGETFVKPVAVGDDCVDVVAKGLWATPTQESTAQYDYTFANSWSATPNGSADANILKNITEDKTVYAVFTATLRMYTITWLDSDGVTELPGQKQWAYGTVPSYTPTKDGYAFDGWTPTPVAVTGDASYTAVWTEGIGGTLTDTIVWKHDKSTGVLTISGTGAMPGYTSQSAQPWRTYWQTITKVVVEEGITALGEQCFYGLSNVTEISLPSTLQGELAQYSCASTAITSIVIPEGVTSLGYRALYSAKGLTERTSVVLPQSLIRIEDGAFQYATNLKAIDIPANVNYIGKNAFGGNNYNAMTLENVYFANPNGWWVSSSADATSGTEVTVTSASTAATYLKNTYKERYWHRT